MKTHGEENNLSNFVHVIIFTSQFNRTPIFCKDLFVVKLVSQFNMCRQICLAVVGGGAPRNGAAKIPLPCVSLHVVIQAELDMKLPPTSGTLVVLVVPAALLLAISSTFRVLKTFPTIRAERARFHSLRTSDLEKESIFVEYDKQNLLTKCDECFHTSQDVRSKGFQPFRWNCRIISRA